MLGWERISPYLAQRVQTSWETFVSNIPQLQDSRAQLKTSHETWHTLYLAIALGEEHGVSARPGKHGSEHPARSPPRGIGFKGKQGFMHFQMESVLIRKTKSKGKTTAKNLPGAQSEKCGFNLDN